MNQYSIKFVVINQAPATSAAADALSIQITQDYGSNGWQLVAVTPLPSGGPVPGLLLTLQKT